MAGTKQTPRIGRPWWALRVVFSKFEFRKGAARLSRNDPSSGTYHFVLVDHIRGQNSYVGLPPGGWDHFA